MTPGTLLLNERIGRFWLYEVSSKRGRGFTEVPADVVWLKMLGEADEQGNVIDASLAGTLQHVTPYQAEQMRVVRSSIRAQQKERQRAA